jgi:glycosyltransferase involved in cell wall biosynthesis
MVGAGPERHTPGSLGQRVLMLLGNNPYPQDQRVRIEAAALSSAGYEVSVICPGRADQPSRDTVDGIHVYRYRDPMRKPSGVLGYMWEYVRATLAALVLSFRIRGGFDVVHAHNPPDTFALVGLVHKLRGKRFVFDHHDLAPEMYDAVFGDDRKRLVHRVLVLLERLSLRAADRVIATNDSYRAVAIERGRVPPDSVVVVRNGPDLNRIRVVDEDPELRSAAPTIIGYAGEIGHHDGLEYLLQALHWLVVDLGYRDTLCVIVGDGDALADVKQLASELELDGDVRFTGYVHDAELLCRYLSTVDICVEPVPSNPYTDRSTMVKLMEYMALGKPIVAFDLPEHRTTAEQSAAYARPNDARALAGEIAALIDDPERRAEMGAVGRRRVVDELAWEHSIPSLLECYAQLFETMPRG